jgi:CRP-like cAMP-binding protein
VRRFESGRDFYVILAGRAEVHVGDRVVRTLEPGEFFGELAALDWGAGFGYARTATVAATTPSQLLVLSPAALGEVMRRAPAVQHTVRAAASERIKRT